MKKLLFIVLVLVIASSLWAGGGRQDTQTGEPVLNYWVPIHFNAVAFIQTYAENEAYMEIMRRLGIRVNFIHPAQGGESESFNLMMASGDLPDIIGQSNRYQGGYWGGIEDGVFIELTSRLERDAPDYYRLINSTPELRREIYNENGQVGAFWRIGQWPPAPIWMRAIVRKDWLEEFNMPPPRTWAQYEEFFQAVQRNKPDAAPFYYPIGHSGVDAMYHGFNLAPGWFHTNGRIRFGNGDPELREYLTLMNDWYNKGYISRDFPSITQQQIWSLFDTGSVGMYWDSVDSSGARTANLPFAIESLPRPRHTENSRLHFNVSPNRRAGDETSIVSTSRNIDAAFKFLNYGYSEEGSMLFNFGIEGRTYNMVNGRPVYTDYILNHPQFTTENANYILRIHFAPKLGANDLSANPTVVRSPESVAFRNQWSNDPNEDGAYILPPLRLTTQENTRRAEIMTNVNTMAAEMILRFIIGSEPLSNFDNYLNQLNQLGLPEAIRITQAAYDRYMRN